MSNCLDLRACVSVSTYNAFFKGFCFPVVISVVVVVCFVDVVL